MKTFEKDGKINFVDDNNVFVGFDWRNCCCEDFGYSITPELPAEDAELVQGNAPDTEGYQFDTSYSVRGPSGGDEGGRVSFRLLKGSDVLYLTLWNHHNGYYSHGFSMSFLSNTFGEIFSGLL